MKRIFLLVLLLAIALFLVACDKENDDAYEPYYTYGAEDGYPEDIQNTESVMTDSKYAYAVEKILCIGDSLTAGSYYASDCEGNCVDQNYPYYLGRMLNCTVTNAGRAGYSASDWVNQYLGQYAYSEFDTVIVWLGTNYGCVTMPSKEEIAAFTPDASAAAESADQAQYLIHLIETVKMENPDCFIVLCNCFASKSDVDANNRICAQIAEEYELLLVDMSDLTAKEHPELHANISNPHLGKAGNIYVASRICTEIESYLAEDPARCEFGLSIGK